MMKITVVVVVLVVAAATTPIDLTCKDENNNTVDWFVIYKLPLDKKHPDRIVRSGEAYMYLGPDSKSWTLGSRPIGDPLSAPGHTLAPLYGTKPNANIHILYNDEPAGKGGASGGHSKGAILADRDTGFWLIHSVPRWPEPEGSTAAYSYPETAREYGQSLLCVRLERAAVEVAATQLQYIRPHIYSSSLSEQFAQYYPQLDKLIEKKWSRNPPYYRLANITSVGGVRWMSLSKGEKWGKELWADWVAAALNTDLLVETWRHGPGALPSRCAQPPQHSVFNVLTVDLPQPPLPAPLLFSDERDHSKWAVGLNNTYICIGDINRAAPQAGRGGGTLCTRELPILWRHFHEAVHSTEPCRKH